MSIDAQVLERPPSPCVGSCGLDGEARFCTGCFRLIDEIMRWRDMDPLEQHAVLSALPGRRATSPAVA